MAESTLSLAYDDLMNSVSYFLFGEADHDDLAEADDNKVDDIVQAGYRQFLYPPATDGVPKGYEWSFLSPWTSIDTIATYDTGTVGVATNICTLTGGTWPSWAYTHGILTIDGTEYTVTARTDDTHLAVTGDDVDSGTSYSLQHNGNQDLPDAFGHLIDGFIFDPDAQYTPVLADVGEGKILRLRAQDDSRDRPRVAAVRIKAYEAGSGQRREVMWYPIPDDVYTLHYRYEAYAGAITDTNYPLGAMKHGETLNLSCLAKADAVINDNYGIHWENFLRSLVSSVERDMKEGEMLFGNVGAIGDYEDETHGRVRGYTLTVGEEVIEE